MSQAVTPVRLGLGGAGLGNLYRAVSEADAEATVHAALAQGFGLIDTAPYYGHGLSEMRIGRALGAWRGARPVLSSKVGRVLEPLAAGESAADFGFADPAPFAPRFDYSRGGVRRSLESSLERLGVARLDIALVHDIGAMTHGAANTELLRQVLDEALPELAAAREEGLIGAIGLGVNEVEVCADVLERAPLDCILLAGRYTILEQPALTSGLLARCAARGVRLLAAGVFNSGLLATQPTAVSTYNYAAAPGEILARAERLWALCASFGVEPQAAAVQFPAAHPVVAHVVVGARSAAEIADIARWRAATLPKDLWTALKRQGLIAAEAPTP